MNCPTCKNPLTLGESRVWVRADGKVAHVKCDPIPDPAPAPASKPTEPKAAPGTVGILRWTDKGYTVTVEGVVVFTGPSGTAVSKWKKGQPNLTLVRDPETVEQEDARQEARDRRALDRLTNRKRP